MQLLAWPNPSDVTIGPLLQHGLRGLLQKYFIDLQITSPYNSESSGAAERDVGLLKKNKEEGLCFEEVLAAFKNTRSESGFSPHQLFFLT